MDAGDLRYMIRLNWPAKSSDKFGETAVSDTPAATAFISAAMRQLSAAEVVRNGITDADAVYLFKIRYRANVSEKCKIVFDGRTFDISSTVAAGRSNREWIDILATEVKS